MPPDCRHDPPDSAQRHLLFAGKASRMTPTAGDRSEPRSSRLRLRVARDVGASIQPARMCHAGHCRCFSPSWPEAVCPANHVSCFEHLTSASCGSRVPYRHPAGRRTASACVWVQSSRTGAAWLLSCQRPASCHAGFCSRSDVGQHRRTDHASNARTTPNGEEEGIGMRSPGVFPDSGKRGWPGLRKWRRRSGLAS